MPSVLFVGMPSGRKYTGDGIWNVCMYRKLARHKLKLLRLQWWFIERHDPGELIGQDTEDILGDSSEKSCVSTTAYHAGYENDKRNESHANHDDLESGRTIRKRYSPEPVRAPLKKLILSLSERDQVVVCNTGSVCVCRKKNTDLWCWNTNWRCFRKEVCKNHN